MTKNGEHISRESALFDDLHLRNNGVHLWQLAFNI